MEAKKISFGFSKINKKPNLLPAKKTEPEESKVELIKCLEGQEIKLVVERAEEAPLIIPMKENQRTSAALASLMKRRAVLLEEEEAQAEEEKEKEVAAENIKANTNDNESKEDLEKRAARELLEEVKGNAEATESSLVLPVVKPDDLPLDGAKESTLDDYDNIPIQQFGMAMLRGMGFVEPPKTKGAPPADETPTVRPKGMGLGADKALKRHVPLIPPEKNEVLEIKKQAFVRILGGKQKDMYGQVEGFDDYAGRVIVKLAIGGAKEAFNEFLCQPVSKKEYAQYSKCINTAKYEEYKRRENENGQIIAPSEQSEERKIKVEKEDKKPYIKEEREEGEMKREIKKERHYEDEKKYIKQEKPDKYEHKEDERNERRREEDRDRRRDDYKEKRRDDYKEQQRNENGRSHHQQSTERRDEKRRQGDYKERQRGEDNGRSYQQSSDRRQQRYQDERADISKSSHRGRSPAREQQSRHHNAPSSSNSRSRNRSATPKRSSSDDSASSEDSDSAYERKQKKCKHKSKSKHKSKKSKSKSSRQRKAQSSDENDSSSDDDSDEDGKNSHKRNSNKFKKKTKKSKRERSRSRSRGRR